jgi:hypothetical protein
MLQRIQIYAGAKMRLLRQARSAAEPVYEALRRIAFEERLKIHDVVLEGIDAILRWHPIATRRPT